MPQAGASTGMPAPIEACRAGFWPVPAASIWPRITSDTSPGSTPRALERGLDGDLAQLVRRQAGQRAVERADRRARGAGDDDGA